MKGLTIIKPKDKGFRPKSEFLFHFYAEFTQEALIQRKCIVLNSQGLIDSICKGLLEESRIPVYRDPYVRNMVNYRDANGNIMPRFLPLYSIYFVYQRENNRYLLGRDYKFEPNRPFGDQIIGWVDACRVFDYNTRLCFEPNFEAEAVKQRRCDKTYGSAKVFATTMEVESFIKNPTSTIEPYWEEPTTWYLRQPNKFFISGSFNIQRFRNVICANNCDPGTKCFFNAFTNNEEQSSFFRFPFLKNSLTDKRKFEIAVNGKYMKNWKIYCDSLIKNKNILKVYFIFPDSLSNNYFVSFLRQFSSKYSDFYNAYNACFYPQQLDRFAAIGIQPWNSKNFNIIMDSLIHHKPVGKYFRNENCFFYLELLVMR